MMPKVEAARIMEIKYGGGRGVKEIFFLLVTLNTQIWCCKTQKKKRHFLKSCRNYRFLCNFPPQKNMSFPPFFYVKLKIKKKNKKKTIVPICGSKVITFRKNTVLGELENQARIVGGQI